MKQVFDTMSAATGVDFTEIMRANTYDAKVNRNIHVEGDPETAVNAEKAVTSAAVAQAISEADPSKKE